MLRGVGAATLLVAIVFLGCARWEKAEAVAHQEARHLELERVHRELDAQQAVLEKTLAELHQQDRALAELQKRTAAGEASADASRETLVKNLAALRKKLSDEEARHRELAEEARKLGAEAR